MSTDPYANFRNIVNGPPQAMKSYRILSPRDTTITATCEQVGCKHWREGWDTLVDERTPLGAAQAHYIRHESGRTFREGRTSKGWTVFRFESHQRCFADHKTRPQVFAVTGGDARGNPLQIPPRRHKRAADWVEDFAEHQDRIATARDKG